MVSSTPNQRADRSWMVMICWPQRGWIFGIAVIWAILFCSAYIFGQKTGAIIHDDYKKVQVSRQALSQDLWEIQAGLVGPDLDMSMEHEITALRTKALNTDCRPGRNAYIP